MPNFNPINPTKHRGTNKYITFFVSRNRQPTGADYRQPETGTLYSVGTVWQVGNSPTTGTEGDLWMLSKIVANVGYWVLISGGTADADSFHVDTFTGPGTNPVIPTNAGLITITGGQIANAGLANVIQTNSLAANTYTIQIQRAGADAIANINKNGVAHFNNTQFTVDSDGFVSLSGGGLAVDSFTVQAVTAPGVNPVTPDGAGIVTVNAAAVAAHSVPIESRSRALNAYNIEVQEASAVAATDATKSGISHFFNTHFIVDANGFVSSQVATTSQIGIVTLASQTQSEFNTYGTNQVVQSGEIAYMMAKPAPIGSGTPNTGAFTSLSSNAGQTFSAAVNTFPVESVTALSTGYSSPNVSIRCHMTGQVPASILTGFGNAIELFAQTTDGSEQLQASYLSGWTVTTPGSESSKAFIRNRNAGVNQDIIIFFIDRTELLAGTRLRLGSGGVDFMSGAGDPNGAISAAKGSYYARTDGSSTSTRAYINTDSGTTWTAVTTVA